MLRLPWSEVLVELGGEPLDGSGFESEEHAEQNDNNSKYPEVSR